MRPIAARGRDLLAWGAGRGWARGWAEGLTGRGGRSSALSVVLPPTSGARPVGRCHGSQRLGSVVGAGLAWAAELIERQESGFNLALSVSPSGWSKTLPLSLVSFLLRWEGNRCESALKVFLRNPTCSLGSSHRFLSESASKLRPESRALRPLFLPFCFCCAFHRKKPWLEGLKLKG